MDLTKYLSLFALFTFTSWPAQANEIVRASDVGEDWALVSDSVEIGCVEEFATYFEINGVRYGLNGQGLKKGYLEPDEAPRLIDEERRTKAYEEIEAFRDELGDQVDFIRQSCDSRRAADERRNVAIRLPSGQIAFYPCPPYVVGNIDKTIKYFRLRAIDFCE